MMLFGDAKMFSCERKEKRRKKSFLFYDDHHNPFIGLFDKQKEIINIIKS